MKVQSAFLALGMAFAGISGACSSGSGLTGSAGTTGNGATGGTGGTSSTGNGGSCPDGAACGGNVIGTWMVTSSCLKVTGQLDPTLVSLNCPAPQVTGSLSVSGTWTANSDGTVSDNTITTGTEQFTLDKACLILSSTPVACEKIGSLFKTLGYATVTCAMAGTDCACTATVQQTGGLGVVSGSPAATNYTTTGSTLTTMGDANTNYTYCAQGNMLTVTPHSTSPTVGGTIVLQKNGLSGSAGTSGGTSGTAGTSGQAGGAAAGNSGRGGRGGTGGTGGTGTGGATAGTTGAAGSTGMAGSGSAGSSGNMGPCDVYKAAGNTCVAAHSTIRALSAAYNGKLYQIRNSAGTTKDINTVGPGGVADAAAQSTFCSGTTCLIIMIYDQTGHGLDLTYEGSGSPIGGLSNVQPATATKEPIKLGGATAYGLWLDNGKAYWVDGSAKGMPLGKEPEGIYMVTSGTHVGGICCFDYGNAGTGRFVAGNATMDALHFSTMMTWGQGAGNGPWVMADLEGGVYAQNDQGTNPNDLPQTSPFVTAVMKNNGTTEMTLRGGNAASGSLTTFYKGALPNGYSPMKKQGAIVLGSGGDCCKTNMNLAVGTFYEGAIVSGYPTDATEDAVQASIVAAKYSK